MALGLFTRLHLVTRKVITVSETFGSIEVSVPHSIVHSHTSK